MATPRRNMEDQESSIKIRATEVFSDSSDTTKTKSFTEYLRETPPTPLPLELKALLWVVGLIVAMLFFGAILRIQRGPRRPRTESPPASSSRLRPQMRRSTQEIVSHRLATSRMDLLEGNLTIALAQTFAGLSSEFRSARG